MKYVLIAIAVVAVAITNLAWHPPGHQAHAQEGKIPSGIVWYGVLNDGIAEAAATGKPIMMMSAAPQCAGVPGMW